MMSVLSYSADVESVAVIKTHFFNILFAIIFSVVIGKWIFPAILTFLYKREQDRLLKIEAENSLLKDSLKRLADRQQVMNEAIVDGINTMNKNMVELMTIITKNSKNIMSIILLLTILGFSACDSDVITLYKFKAPQITDQLKDNSKKFEVSKEKKPPEDLQKVKTCTEKCDPPKTTCNENTGKCEGSANSPSLTSEIDYMEIGRYGRFDPQTETYEVVIQGRK